MSLTGSASLAAAVPALSPLDVLQTKPRLTVRLRPPVLDQMDNCLPTQFQALGDRTRFAVVESLLEGPVSVSELARPQDMALPAFTKHLGILERSGLITSTKTGRVRTCAINPEAFTTIEQWFVDRRAHWNSRLDRLALHLAKPGGE